MKMFDAGEIGMIRLPYGKKNYDNMLTSCFQPIPERHGRMDGGTELLLLLLLHVETENPKSENLKGYYPKFQLCDASAVLLPVSIVCRRACTQPLPFFNPSMLCIGVIFCNLTRNCH